MQTQPADSLGTSTLLAIIAMLPAVNADALIGAFAGAAVYVLGSSELSLAKRALGMIAGVVMGYSLGPHLAPELPIIKSDVLASFLVSAFIVVIAVALFGTISKTRISIRIAVGWDELKSLWPFRKKGE